MKILPDHPGGRCGQFIRPQAASRTLMSMAVSVILEITIFYVFY